MKRAVRIGIVMEFKGSEEAQAILEGAVQFANGHPGMRLVEVPFSQSVPPPASTWKNIDGILAWVSEGNRWILETPLPKVNCCQVFPLEQMPVVAYAGKSLVMAVIAHAVRMKAREVIYLQERPEDFLAADFSRTFTRQLAPRNIGYSSLLLAKDDPAEKDGAADELLASRLQAAEKPVLIWATSAVHGRMACRAARHAGLSIPEDVAVMVPFDSRTARQSAPPLSAVPLPGQLLGREAMSYLLAVIRGETPPRRIELEVPPVIHRTSTERPKGPAGIARAQELIRQYTPEGLTVQELADLMGMSRTWLIRKFQKEFGRSPMQAIHAERAERIRRWLDSTDMTVARIAKISGFKHHNHLFRFFRKETGMTPQEYRDRLQKQ